MLIRLWILDKYHNNIDIPHITLDTIKMAFKSIVKSSSGPKPKGNNLQLYEEFKKLYNKLGKHSHKKEADYQQMLKLLLTIYGIIFS